MARSTPGMVCAGETWSNSPSVWGMTPVVPGLIPVSVLAREPLHSETAQNALAKVTPCAASRSMVGVWTLPP